MKEIVTQYLIALFFCCLISCESVENTKDNFLSTPEITAKDSAVFNGKNAYENWQKVEKYYKNKKLKQTYLLFQGQKKGLFQQYFRNGLLEKEGDYLNGKKTGKWTIYYSGKNENSSLLKQEEAQYEAGLKHGLYVQWHKNGQKKKQMVYQKGNQSGEGLEWHSNGQQASRLFFVEHLPHGVAKMWHDNGQLKLQGQFEMGKRVGLFKDWFENGQLMREMYHKDGLRHGPFKIWDENGTLLGEGVYENGGLEEMKHYN